MNTKRKNNTIPWQEEQMIQLEEVMQQVREFNLPSKAINKNKVWGIYGTTHHKHNKAMGPTWLYLAYIRHCYFFHQFWGS